MFLQVAVCVAEIAAWIGLMIVLANWLEARRFERYAKDHPPISDEEFLRRCQKGVNPEVALKVRAIISEQSGVDESMIYPDSRLTEIFCE